MSSDSAYSKFDYDPYLFKPEPPRDAELVKRLFCGRKQELARGVAGLTKCLDVRGKRAASHDKQPWIIHGESRCGKSHLARRILLELPQDPRYLQITIPAREQLNAALVMRNLFVHLSAAFAERQYDQGAEEDLSCEPQMTFVEAVIERVTLYFENRDPASLKVTRTHSSKLVTQAGLKASLSKSMEMWCSTQADQQAENKIEITLPAPTPEQLAEYCGLIIDVLIRLDRLDHCLILVDDVDLLEGYVEPTKDTRLQRSLLARALCELHNFQGIDVLLTARTWYANTQKEFHVLVDMTDKELSSEDLVRIHDRRFEHYGGPMQHGYLDMEALTLAAEDAQGLPGVFLQQLETAFQRYQDEPEWGKRGYDWYLNTFVRLYLAYQQKFPAAAKILEEAANAGQLQIEMAESNPFYGTPLDNAFVFQSYFRESHYIIPGLVHKIVRSCVKASPTGDGINAGARG